MRQARGGAARLRPRDSRFFRYGEGVIKNGRCVPAVLGEGSGLGSRRCSPAKPRRSHLGLAGRARCQRHKMAARPRVHAHGAAPRSRVVRCREDGALGVGVALAGCSEGKVGSASVPAGGGFGAS